MIRLISIILLTFVELASHVRLMIDVLRRNEWLDSDLLIKYLMSPILLVLLTQMYILWRLTLAVAFNYVNR